ncbi:hypothetical protein [Brachybacterium sp. GPGPB12]|uniref:hypothetical protein n=1 Tax=Brachybacterium sp. GPGPB12 TaxID=3023517 RepID=UPI0031343544
MSRPPRCGKAVAPSGTRANAPPSRCRSRLAPGPGSASATAARASSTSSSRPRKLALRHSPRTPVGTASLRAPCQASQLTGPIS